MFKKLFSMIILALFVGSVVITSVLAAVTAQSAGTNLGVVERVNFSTGLTATKSGDKVTVITSVAQTPTSITVGSPTIGGVLGTNFVAIKDGLEVDGSVYFDGVIIDASLYSATSGTSLNRTLCVDSAGKVFSSAAACP